MVRLAQKLSLAPRSGLVKLQFMKTARLLRIASVCVLMGTAVLARDLKTTNGDVYKNITITKQDPTGLQITHDDGVAFIDFRLLGPTEQKEFGYDPAAYVAAWKQKAEAAAKAQQALAAQQAAARARAQQQQQQQAEAQANNTEVPRPPANFTNQTGVEATVDTPGFRYGSYNYQGRSYQNAVPPSQGGAVPYPYANSPYVNPNPYNLPIPYNGPTWGPTILRQR